MNRTLAKMIPTVTLLIFTEQLKEEKAMDVKDYAIAIASVTTILSLLKFPQMPMIIPSGLPLQSQTTIWAVRLIVPSTFIGLTSRSSLLLTLMTRHIPAQLSSLLLR